MKKLSRTVLGLMLMAMSLGGCQAGDGPADANGPGGGAGSRTARSLYERLGGQPGITVLMNEFVNRAMSNPKVNFTRQGTDREWTPTPENVAHVTRQLVLFTVAKTGGPQNYKGKDMASAHAGMQISNPEFDAAAGELIAAMDAAGVPQKEKDELIAIIATTRADIVEMK